MGKKGKGKQPKGRAKQRQKPSSGSWAQDFARNQLDDSDDNPHKMFKGFAQGAPRGDFSQRGPNVKLRHQTITFVSAGSDTPVELESTKLEHEINVTFAGEDAEMSDDEEEVEELHGSEEIDDSGIQTNIVVDADVELSEGAFGRMNIHSPASPKDLFFVDTTGDPAFATKPAANGKRPIPRSPSPARSESSDDVVLFHGRSQVPTQPATTSAPRKPTSTIAARAPHVTDDLLAALGGSPEPYASSSPAKGWASRPSKYDRQAASSADETWRAAPSQPYWRKGKPRPDLDPQPGNHMMLEDTPSRVTKVAFAEPENEDAEETIAELQADWSQVLREKRLAKGVPRDPNPADDLDIDLGKKPNRRGKRGRKKANRQLRDAILSDEDEDDESAYDDYMANLAAQLDAEDGRAPVLTAVNLASEAGPSLVVNGKEVAEDNILKHDTEQEWKDEESDSSASEGPIGQDLSELSDMDIALNMSDLESSELEEELEYTEREQWEDEQDLRQRRQDAMTDEHLARLFAKQQELGIDGDDIVIDDGVFDELQRMDGIGDLNAARVGLQEITNSPFACSSTRPKRTHRRNGDFSFPDASALADTVEQYGENGFDIMDYDRPSLRTPKKGRKGKLPPELEGLSDDELREDIAGAWERNRAQKRAKKAEREELRAQGLLGASGKMGKADLGQRYRRGMTMKQVQEELAIFLQDDGQKSRPFPPIAKKDRASLHQVADALNLKSKSVGSGHNRFPVLYKTSFTLEYSEFMLNKIMYSASRGFLENASGKGKKGRGMAGAPNRSRRGFDKAAVGLRNGEIVGGSARELGRENFGHRLMEKMGWQAGTALGKDGEGLLVPVAQVMRSGKAGLG